MLLYQFLSNPSSEVRRGIDVLERALARTSVRHGTEAVEASVGLGAHCEDTIALVIRVKHRKLKPEEIMRLVTSYQLGTCVSDLARQFDVHRGTVHAHLARANVEVRPPAPALDPAAMDDAVELYERGLSLAAIGKKLDTSAGSVQRALIARGVRIRDRSERV